MLRSKWDPYLSKSNVVSGAHPLSGVGRVIGVGSVPVFRVQLQSAVVMSREVFRGVEHLFARVRLRDLFFPPRHQVLPSALRCLP